MARNYTGAGGLFTRLGKLGALLNPGFAMQQNYQTLADAAADQYDDERTLTVDLINNQQTWRAYAATPFTAIRQLAQATVQRWVFREDAVRPRTIESSLRAVLDWMIEDSQTVNSCAVTATITAASGNIGNGTATVQVTRPSGGNEQFAIDAVTILEATLPTTSFLHYESTATNERWRVEWPHRSEQTGRIAVGATEHAPLYASGPRVRIVAGTTEFVVGDQFILTVENDYAGATNRQTFQWLFERFFDMRSFGLQLPHSTTPTISDSLIA